MSKFKWGGEEGEGGGRIVQPYWEESQSRRLQCPSFVVGYYSRHKSIPVWIYTYIYIYIYILTTSYTSEGDGLPGELRETVEQYHIIYVLLFSISAHPQSTQGEILQTTYWYYTLGYMIRITRYYYFQNR